MCVVCVAWVRVCVCVGGVGVGGAVERVCGWVVMVHALRSTGGMWIDVAMGVCVVVQDVDL